MILQILQVVLQNFKKKLLTFFQNWATPIDWYVYEHHTKKQKITKIHGEKLVVSVSILLMWASVWGLQFLNKMIRRLFVQVVFNSDNWLVLIHPHFLNIFQCLFKENTEICFKSHEANQLKMCYSVFIPVKYTLIACKGGFTLIVLHSFGRKYFKMQQCQKLCFKVLWQSCKR